MATLEKIRSKAGILVAGVIGLALLAFILGDFLTGKSSFFFTGGKNDVGTISGKSVSIQLLEQKFKEMEGIQKLMSGKANLDEADVDKIKESAWQQVVYEKVLEKEFDKIGLTVSPAELFDLIEGPNPNPLVRRAFANQETGEFNRNQLIQFMKATNESTTATPDQMAFRLYLEQEVRTERINNKYFNLILKGLTVPAFLAKDDYVASNKKVDCKYLAQLFTGNSDNNITINPSDIKKYYNDHKYLYYNQAVTRDIEFVSFNVVPAKEDTMSAKEWIAKIKPDFQKTPDPESFVSGNSDESYVDKNYKESDLPDSLNMMFKEQAGALHGPYFEGGAFKLARLDKIVFVPDSVKACHILITPKGNTQPDVAKAKAMADSLKILIDKGADFAKLAMQYSADKSNSLKGGDLGWFTEGKMVKPFNDTAFSAKKGAVKVVETSYGYHIIKVQDKSPEQKRLKIAFIQRKVIASKQTYDKYYAAAIKFASDNRTKEQFDAACAKQRLLKQPATNIGENDKNIPGIGASNIRTVVDWIYNAKTNEVSEPLTVGDQYIVATLAQIKEKGTAPLDQVRGEVTLMVRKEKQAELIAEKINKAKEGVNSIDVLASKLNAPVEFGNGITFSTYSIGNTGVEPKLVAYAINSPLHKVSAPIQGNNGVYVVEVLNITEAPAIKDYTSSKQNIENNLQRRASYESYNALIKLANINDNRRKFGF